MKKFKIPHFLTLLVGILITTSCINIYCDCDSSCENESEQNNNQIILQPDSIEGKDAFIEDYPLREYRNSNFGTHPAFQASAWTAQSIPFITRCLIDFDFSKIPNNATISCAKLILHPAENTAYGTGHSNRSGSNSFLVQRITNDWDELSVTWNNQPSVTTNSQAQVGENENSMLVYEIVITKLVRDILDNPSESHGLMIRLATEEYYRRILFASSDYDDSSKHPKLLIEYN